MLKLKLRTIYKIFFFLFLFTVVSRGFYELFLEKKTAFLVQVIVILLFIIFSMIVFKIKLEAKYFTPQMVLFLIFSFAVLFSIIITQYLENGGAPVFYSAIMCFLIFSFVFISSFNINRFGAVNIGNMIIILIIILFVTSLYEQITETPLPGASWHGGTVRPASLTGSKQHYSIILSILTLFIYQYWLSLKKAKYLFGFLIGVIGVLLSLTRSGSMILVLAFFPYICYKLYSNHLVKINPKLLLFIFIVSIFTVIFSILYFDIGFFFDRMISSIDAKSPGNDGRIKAWLLGLDLIFSSNMIFGEYTGVVTNATRTITNTKSFVVESGTLQMILNFGLIGFMSFYLILFNIYSRIKREHTFLLFVLFSCLISTIVYQSIETIPFVILLALIPLISSDVKNIGRGSLLKAN